MKRLLNLPPALRFIAIGGSAAVVHLAVVRLVVDARWLVPAWANVLGWLVAFAVSFSGHFYWTFARQGTSLVQALPRFFLLSAAGFAINQAAYVLALRFVPWRYDVLLACVLVAVAVGTYVFSKLWAFKASAACKRVSGFVATAVTSALDVRLLCPRLGAAACALGAASVR